MAEKQLQTKYERNKKKWKTSKARKVLCLNVSNNATIIRIDAATTVLHYSKKNNDETENLKNVDPAA